MQIHTFFDTAEADLAGIGREDLAGSGFENEDPETDFVADVVTAIPSNQREE